jgi:hypothetical protein
MNHMQRILGVLLLALSACADLGASPFDDGPPVQRRGMAAEPAQAPVRAQERTVFTRSGEGPQSGVLGPFIAERRWELRWTATDRFRARIETSKGAYVAHGNGRHSGKIFVAPAGEFVIDYGVPEGAWTVEAVEIP